MGRPQKFKTEDAWEIYQSLPQAQRNYANVARVLSNRLNLDPPLVHQTIAHRFIKDGLVEKQHRGGQKRKSPMKTKPTGRPRLLDTSVAVKAYKELGSIEKVAEVTGFSPSTVRSRLLEAGVLKRKPLKDSCLTYKELRIIATELKIYRKHLTKSQLVARIQAAFEST